MRFKYHVVVTNGHALGALEFESFHEAQQVALAISQVLQREVVVVDAVEGVTIYTTNSQKQ